MTIDEAISAAQALVEGLTALKAAMPVTPTQVVDLQPGESVEVEEAPVAETPAA